MMANVTAQPHFVFGVRTGVRNNVCFCDEHTVVFPSGNNCVCYNTAQASQRLIPGRPNLHVSGNPQPSFCRRSRWNRRRCVLKTFAEVDGMPEQVRSSGVFLQVQREARACVLWPSVPAGGTWQWQSAGRHPPSPCWICTMNREEEGRF